jgi:hypothetical protein
MVFVGLDWAEEHHDVAVIADDGTLLAELRITDSLDGVNQLHALFAQHATSPSDVVIGAETANGLVLRALAGAGYTVYEINPIASSRYRDRHRLSRAKSDRADAKMLADVVRTDRHNHRPFAGSSSLAEAVKVLARTHQSLIWTRQDHLNRMRTTLRDFYPAVLAAFPQLCSSSERDCPDAMALLQRAATPAQGRTLSQAQIRTVLQRAGRQRSIERRAEQIQHALRDSRRHRARDSVHRRRDDAADRRTTAGDGLIF